MTTAPPPLLVPIAELLADPRNARKHSRENIEAIKASLTRFGQQKPVVVGGEGHIIAGSGTLQAASELDGWTHLKVERSELVGAEAIAYGIADNRTAELAEWDDTVLTELLGELDELTGTGFSSDDLDALLAGLKPVAFLADPDAIPDPPKTPVSRTGDLWLLGPHRLLCGDSLDPDAVARLFDGQVAEMIHADPPYGMGKESDGVANDNLYGPKLDAFQMGWWTAWAEHLTENGSAYVWGNAPDLWRLWWVGGLGAVEGLMVRNEIVWDKKSVPGMASAAGHSFPPATERCLFLMRGQQFIGNQNKDEYWEGYEPLRAFLVDEVARAGWAKKDVDNITNSHMAGHWLGKSQFFPINRANYELLADAAAGRAFTKTYDELFADLFPDLKDGGNAHRRELAARLRERRTHFDNTHDAMTDVWEFSRVYGEERLGHATPKPVAMVERAMLTSSPAGAVVGVPFSGTGPEYIAAHIQGRRAFGMELEPAYVDVICKRYQQATGTMPILDGGGPTDFAGE